MPSDHDGLSTRLPPGMRQQINRCHETHLTNDSLVTIKLWEAFLAAAKREGGVRFPISVQMAGRQEAAAEEKDAYHTGQKKVDPPPKPGDKSQRIRGDGPRRAVPKSA